MLISDCGTAGNGGVTASEMEAAIVVEIVTVITGDDVGDSDGDGYSDCDVAFDSGGEVMTAFGLL